MENFIEMLKTDEYIIGLFCINIILLIGFIANLIKSARLSKKYKTFMKKIGSSETIEEDLETFMYRVRKVEEQNGQIFNDIKELNEDLTKCVQKVGMVRYSAFQDAGSDLSFTLALLDEHDNGVILNGIYSREMSNIYAKPIKNGKSTYTLSEEETMAIKKAISREKDV